MNLVLRAADYAQDKHRNQMRKYDGSPYFVHCNAVKELLLTYGHYNEDWLCAALLHDTVEDTDATIQEIRTKFNDHIAELVYWLTDFKHEREGNRETRKLITCWKLSVAPLGAKLIKLADLIDNTKDIVKGDPDFAIKYLKEKRDLIEHIQGGADHTDWLVMQSMVDAARKQVEV